MNYRIFGRIQKQRNTQMDEWAVIQAENRVLAASLAVNEAILRKVFRDCGDLVVRRLPNNESPWFVFFYIKGLADTGLLDEVMLKPLIFEGKSKRLDKSGLFPTMIEDELVAIAEVERVKQLRDIVERVLMGEVAILTDGEDYALLANLCRAEKRGIEESRYEPTVRGPRDGFTETLLINMSLIRRRLYTPRLKMEIHVLGEISRTQIAIAYVDGIVSTVILDEVRQRIRGIKADSILESGYIEELIEDAPLSPFPQVQNTDRPDTVCASLLEGKVAVLVDNTPVALVMPMTLWAGMQAAEDHYERFLYTTVLRWVRFALFLVALVFPSLYVAISTFHPLLLPTNLLITMAAAREGVPFPTAVETLLMEFMFEGLREAGVRLPLAVGSAVSIVGALVIGQSAVEAGIVSSTTVIIVATTGIASFAIPRYNLGIGLRLLRFPLLFSAWALGLYGVVAGLIAILIHLVGLKSFGIPYLAPIAPALPGGWKDTLVRLPRRRISLQHASTPANMARHAANGHFRDRRRNGRNHDS